MTKFNLVGLKEKLQELRDLNLDLETPLVWELPPFFTDEMLKSDLQKLIQSKTNEINDSKLEKVMIFYLDVMIQYFLKTLLEQNLSEKFKSNHTMIDDITPMGLSPDHINNVRCDLHFMLYSTQYAISWLKGDHDHLVLPTRSDSHGATIPALKAWYNMVVYNYKPALQFFEYIAEMPEYGPLFAYYHGKTIARERRERNDWNVTETEIKLLLTGAHRYITLPCILQSFENAKLDSALVFRYRSDFSQILKKAWDSRDAYHSINLCRLASLFLRRKEKDKAVDLFELGIKLNPECGMTLHKYGHLLIQDGHVEKGTEFMIKANHIPAFLTLVKATTVLNDHYNIPQLLDKVELVMTNSCIDPPVRYLMYLYYIENRLTAKAIHHLKALYRDAKGLEFAVAKSQNSQKSMAFLLSVSLGRVPVVVNVAKECEQFRKVCKEFDSWMKEVEPKENSYEVFDIPNL